LKKIIYLFLFLLGCKTPDQNSKLNEKSEDVASYFHNELATQIPNDGIVIILQNQKCSSCRQNTFETLVNKYLKKKQQEKIFILSKSDIDLEKTISVLQNTKIIYDTKHKLKDYGLDYSTDLCFIFSNHKLKKYFEISNIELEKLKDLN